MKNRQEIQESQYSIPYHYLPWEHNGSWYVGRFLWWGYEYLAILETVLKLVKKGLSQAPSETKVLDFGCGDGRLIMELLKRYPFSTIVGVDISERALAFARAATWGKSQVYFFSNVQTAVQKIGQFHVAIAMEVLEHIPPEDLHSVVSELCSSLLDGGYLIVSVPTINVPVNRKHYQHFTLETLREILGRSWVLEEVCYVHRVGVMANLIRRAGINRLFVANSEVWLRFCTWLYKRFVLEADEKTAAHVVCRFRKGKHCHLRLS